MDYKLTEEQKALKQEFEDFFREEMKAAPPEYRSNALEAIYSTDEGWEFHRYMQKKLAEKGWLTMAWPKEFGGRDAPIIEQLIFSEVHAYYRAPGIDGFGVGMFAPTLMLFANEEQKKRLLPPIARGEVNYCQGWSEPNAGSDLASLTTTAIKEGDHYVVNGQKVWTTGAHRADHMFLLARTDPSQKRSSGLSVFNVDMNTPGIEVRPIHYMDGKHLYNEIFFSDVIIPEYDRIGPENEGWKSTRATMNFERSGASSFASAKRSLEELLAYVKTTKRGGKFLYENPVVRQKLAKLYIDIERGRSLAYKAAWNQEKENFILSATGASESKVFGSELFQRITNFATEIMGLHGQLSSSKWAPLNGVMSDGYQWCMGMNIAAGSSEIQRNIIAWVGVGLPRFK
ncbi:MAG: acyl-CoA dehydrogenase family protein [Deltaproteobacteria bacterium]|nr:acyl-CoA dehydrogenase family protein [Deltaproteobacteria bacterium]